MPLANKDFTLYQIPLPRSYCGLSRRNRIVIELIVGILVMALVGWGASVQMPRWLLAAGWTVLVAYWAGWIVLYLKHWVRRQRRDR